MNIGDRVTTSMAEGDGVVTHIGGLGKDRRYAVTYGGDPGQPGVTTLGGLTAKDVVAVKAIEPDPVLEPAAIEPDPEE